MSNGWMKNLGRAVERLFVRQPGESSLLRLVKLLFAVNPILVSAIFFVRRSEWSWWTWAYSVLVADLVTLWCYGALGVLALVRGERGRPRGLNLLGVCAIAMPPGLYLSLRLVRWLFVEVSSPWIPDIVPLGQLGSGLGVAFLILSFFVLLSMHRHAQVSRERYQLRLARAENERLQARLSALTAQMNPHLLFNALNTIASLIESDPRAAEDTTLKLSELLRAVLVGSRRGNHSLARELEICRAYLAVERARFGERLRYDFLIEPRVDLEQVEVPVLLVQPLVENAIKHGLAPKLRGGTIIVRAKRKDDGVLLTVEDDGVGIPPEEQRRDGVGIANTRARLELQYGKAGWLHFQTGTSGGTVAQVSIPAGGT